MHYIESFLEFEFSVLQKCLLGLLSQKTVIYATHQLEFLDGADLVLVSGMNFRLCLCSTIPRFL